MRSTRAPRSASSRRLLGSRAGSHARMPLPLREATSPTPNAPPLPPSRRATPPRRGTRRSTANARRHKGGDRGNHGSLLAAETANDVDALLVHADVLAAEAAAAAEAARADREASEEKRRERQLVAYRLHGAARPREMPPLEAEAFQGDQHPAAAACIGGSVGRMVCR